MADLPWQDAVIRILTENATPMHYADIAEAVAQQGLRTEFGATPANDVNVTISNSLRRDPDRSPFVRVSRGVYGLKAKNGKEQVRQLDRDEAESAVEAGLIHAFGMFWSRDKVAWTSSQPSILGQQQVNSSPVEFSGQQGVYLLYDGRSVVYVGRVIDQQLGFRLKQHTSDRLSGRWDRFSWFGVLPVEASGKLSTDRSGSYGLEMLIITMEALLIEGLEPPQNRKRGDDFRAIEYLQKEDPEVEKSRAVNLLMKTLK